MSLLDLIFPKYCVNCKKYGEYLCTNCFARVSWDTKNICCVCGEPSYEGLTHPSCKGKYTIDGSFTSVVMSPVTRKLVYKFKNKPYLTNLASFMTSLMYEKLIQDEYFVSILKLKPTLVPVPITKNKEKKRGYNQSHILAKSLASKFHLKTLSCLSCIKETRSQVGLSKKERRENVSNAFSLNPKHKIPTTILLIDDVLTSGATVSEASKVLKRGRAKKVWALTFAKED